MNQEKIKSFIKELSKEKEKIARDGCAYVFIFLDKERKGLSSAAGDPTIVSGMAVTFLDDFYFVELENGIKEKPEDFVNRMAQSMLSDIKLRLGFLENQKIKR